MSLEFMTIAMFVVLIATIVTGLPLAYCLAGVATLFGLIDNGWDVPGLFDMFANNCWGLMNNYVLVAIPLFILMAQLLDRSKVAEQFLTPCISYWAPSKADWAWPSSWCVRFLPPLRESSALLWWPWGFWPLRPC
jgi:TRAP-type mannitol/chloroaromatic compound transport system permease large subunit